MTPQERAELEKFIEQAWDKVHELGLDPFPVHFELVPAHIIYEIGAYGLPARFSHWTFGRDYHRQKTMYEYNIARIYELVINTDPSQAFLLENNSLLANKLVVAHVLGHSDFFKNNTYFAHTDRRMVERARLHADRIRQYEMEYGPQKVEQFLDAVLSIEEHIDPVEPAYRRRTPEKYAQQKPTLTRPSSEFDDLLGRVETPEPPTTRRIPPEPEKDLLLFLRDYARDLEDWQRDIIGMVREEMLYFLPQIRTKIMNEGWASLIHERVLEALPLTPAEHIEFRRMHSSVLSPGSRMSLNPYYVGYQILRDIERRWNGEPPEEDEEPETDWLQRPRRRPVGEGWQKLLEVREMECDVTFLRKYLTEGLVKKLDMYTYKLEEVDGELVWRVQETDWEKVRDALLDSMTNFGVPVVTVEDGDYARRGELYLKHHYDGKPLDMDYTLRALKNIYTIWNRPVHLETVVDGDVMVFTYDGQQVTRHEGR
jgi:stage V sporulation protein R